MPTPLINIAFHVLISLLIFIPALSSAGTDFSSGEKDNIKNPEVTPDNNPETQS